MTQAKFKRLHGKWQRKLAVTVGVSLLAVGGLWWVLPGVIAQQLQDKGSAALGRAVTVRSVDVAPWALAVTVHGLEVAGLQGEAPALSIERTYINVSLSSLLRWAPVLDALELDQPVVRLRQESDGQWDFADVLRRLQTSPPPQEEAEPVRLAIYNIQIRDGQIRLNDQVAGVQHEVDALQLQLPFISTLPAQREVKVQPQLSLRLNGSVLQSQAVSTPFHAGSLTQAQLEIQHLDLAPYVPYLPADLPAQLKQGVVSASLQVVFDATEQPTVQLQGSRLEVAGLEVVDSTGQDLAGWSSLKVVLGDTRPLQRQVQLASVVIEAPFAHVHRRGNGRLLPPVAAPVASAVTPQASIPASNEQEGLEHASAAAGAVVADGVEEKIAASVGWTMLIEQFDIKDGKASWRDDAVHAGVLLRAEQMQLQAQHLAWPLDEAAQWSFSALLQGEDRAARGMVRSSGQGGVARGHASLVVDRLDAQALRPYAQQWVKLPVGGLASLAAGVAWKQGQVHAVVPSLAVESVALGAQSSPELSWSGLQVRNLTLDTAQQQVQVEHVALEAPRVRVQRNAQGRWMYEQWLQPVVLAPAKGRETVVSPAGKPWQVLVQEVALAAGQMELTDASLGEQPLAVKLSEMQLRMRNIDSIKGTAQAEFSAQMAERTRRGNWGKPGALSYVGSVQLAPFMTQGRARIQSLPLQAFEPYMAPYLNVRVLRALASFDGDVQYAQRPLGPQLLLQGQASIADAHVQTVGDDVQAAQAVQGATASLDVEDLLRWKQLRLQGIRLSMQPAQPPHLQVRSTELQDFYARVVVLPQGRLNLQNLIKGSEREEPAANAGAAPEALEVAALGSTTEVPVVEAKEVAESAARIDMGPIVLRDGVIKFSDYFIQPHYTADLSALNGSLEAFSSQPVAQGEAPALAKLVLEGVAQGSAALTVEGQVNPLAHPLALDVRAQVKGLDLSPLTPYSIKYAGHGIEKGKLSMDVHYAVQPDGQLTASNQLVLNQLTFSDPVEGAPASLPVRLAVALLADSNGDIDLNLPISGSLNDPQFRIGSVVLKIIGNIIRKAITAPFSLLMGAFSSADERSDIAFDLGQARLNEQAQTSLQQLAKAMQSKPQLKLTLVGQADPAAEAQGWKQAQLARWVEGERVAEGETAERSERQKLAALKKAYRSTVKERPRNMLGLSKEIPPAEMEAMILKDMVIPQAAWQELAAARAQAVRDYLQAQGVDPARVFLGSTGGKSEKPESPAVLLNISVQ